MSARRGVEIHNGYVVIGDAQRILLGTEASPITQGVAGQTVVSAFINAIALGGNVHAGEFGAIATVTRTGEVHGLRALGEVAAGVVVTGTVRGAIIQTSMNALSAIVSAGYQWEGLRVNMYAEATSIMNAPIYGIHVNNYITSAPLSNYYFQRMSENGGVTVEACFYVSVGGAGDITRLMVLAGTHTAWQSTGTPVGPAAGWIAVSVAGVDKAIQLYSV